MTAQIPVTLSHNGELALTLAARGWYVFPCREHAGTPYTTKDGKLTTPQAKAPYWDRTDLRNGKDDATTEPEKIRGWWSRWPGALVGIYCEKSGIWALDIDRKNGTDGGKTFDALVQSHGGNPVVVGIIQGTPTGGMHLLFNLPKDGAKIPNNAGKLGAGLDLRSDGYICSGSLPDGNGYTWINPKDWTGITAPGDVITDAPAWLVELACRTGKESIQPNTTGTPTIPVTDSGAYWLQHYLTGAVNGNRNNNGFALACQLRDSGLSMGEAAGIMRQYAARVPGDGYSESEAIASMEQAYQSPRRKPARLASITAPGMQTTIQPSAQTPGRYRILTAADALKPQPPIDWIVDGLFEAGSLSIVFGLPGTKKTWALLDMGVCVAAGAVWLGRKTPGAPVLVVDEESGERRLLRRLGDTIRGHGCETANLPISAVSLAGFNFRDQAEVNHLHELVLQTGARLVVIDALADIMPGADENAVKDVQPVLHALRAVAEKTGAAIVLIHHANKTGAQYRGSTAILGSVDYMIQVTSEDGTPRLDFTSTKTREDAPFQFAALAHWGDGSFNLSPAGMGARLTDTLFDALHQIGNAGGSLAGTQVKDRNALTRLKDAGYVYRSDSGGQGVTAIYSLTDKGRAYLDENL